MFRERIIDLLNRELVKSLGCTEPIAIALAASLARKYVKGEILKSIKVIASANVIKNAMCVGIPGTNGSGIDFAAALGALAKNTDKNLELLTGLTSTDIEQAKLMLNDGIINLETSDNNKKLYIDVTLETTISTSRVIIEDSHTNVILIEVDGKILKSSPTAKSDTVPLENDTSYINIDIIWDFISNIDFEKLDIIKSSIDLNMKIAHEGLSKPYGLQVGRIFQKNITNGILKDDASTYSMSLTSAASDVRMDGGCLPVISNSGSGNQGIIATVSVVSFGEKLNASTEAIIRAVTLSHLVTIYIKLRFGRLSALCGAAVAGMGASSGIVYLLGGTLEHVKSTIQNMLGNVTGILCDGAKTGCSLKVSTCVSAAIQSALISYDGITISESDGIIAKDVEETIDNLCRLSNLGAIEADKIILDILLNKNRC